MGFISVIFPLVSLCFILALVFLPGLPPHIEFTSYTHDKGLFLEGALARNEKLCKVERIQEDKLTRPESLVPLGPNELYASLGSGHIAYIWGENLENMKIIVQTGSDCDGYWEERKCGRPLGIRLLPDGRLLVADCYFGVFIVEPKTGNKENIIDSKDGIEGVRPGIINDLDYDDEGNIYFSDSSTISRPYDGLIEFLSGPSGRLIKWNNNTRKSEVLLSNIHMANGVQLSLNKDFVLVSETCRFQVRRYWLKGPKAGTSDVFVKGLPGMPDNIRACKEGGYLVSLVSCKDPSKFDFFSVSSEYPLLRRFIVRFLFTMWSVADGLNKMFPNNYTAKLSYWVMNIYPEIHFSLQQLSVVVIVNEDGEIIDSLQCSEGKIKAISETHQVGDYLLFASPFNSYIGRLYIGKDETEPVDKDAEKLKEPEETARKTEL